MSSCSDVAGEQLRLAEAHKAGARDAQRRAASFARGERGEQVVRGVLVELLDEGWTVLHDRRWPGKRRANLDHVLVGPGGVVVLDTKNWRRELRLTNGRLVRGQEDASDAVDGVLAQVADLEDALVRVGLAPLEVIGALVLVGQTMPPHVLGRAHLLDDVHLLRWVRARGQRLTPQQVRALVPQVIGVLEPATTPLRAAIPLMRSRPQPRATQQQALVTAEELDLDELERAARLPLEQWMTYLHPCQLDLVRRRYSGPSRIRGPAGCGKTVIALHRAAYLATQEPGELLVLSYVKTLPAVLASLYRRLSPLTADRVTFTGVHRLAFDIVDEAGHYVRVNPVASETCFNLA